MILNSNDQANLPKGELGFGKNYVNTKTPKSQQKRPLWVKLSAWLDEAATRQTGLDRFCSSMINML